MMDARSASAQAVLRFMQMFMMRSSEHTLAGRFARRDGFYVDTDGHIHGHSCASQHEQG